MNPLEFFRQEQFADELANHLTKAQIQMFLRWGHLYLIEVNKFSTQEIVEEYNVDAKQLSFDKRAVKWNMRQLRRALPSAKKDYFEFVTFKTIGQQVIYSN